MSGRLTVTLLRYGVVAAAVTMVTAAPRSATLLQTTTHLLEVDVPVDDGGPLGTLAEARGADGRVTLTVGFSWANNSTQMANSRVMTVWTADSGHEISVTDLGQPFLGGHAAHLVAVGNDLWAVPYNTLSTAPARWSAANRRWEPIRMPLLDRNVGLVSLQVVDGHPLLLFIHGRASTLTEPQVFYRDRRIDLPRSLEGYTATDMVFFADRVHLFVHDKLGGQAGVAVCRWQPSWPDARGCKIHPFGPVVAGREVFFYAGAPDPNGTAVLWFDRLGRVFRSSDDGLDLLTERAVDASDQVYAAIWFEGALWLGHYPSGNLYRWLGQPSSPGMIPVAPPIGTQPCSTQGLREAQSLIPVGPNIWAGLWPFGEVWEGRPGSPWKLLLRAFPGDACGDAPHDAARRAAGLPEPNLLGQRIWGIALWSTGIAISTAPKHLGAREAVAALPEAERRAYGRVLLIERDAMRSCPLTLVGRARVTIDVQGAVVRVSFADARGRERVVCDVQTHAPVDVSGLWTFGDGSAGRFGGTIAVTGRSEYGWRKRPDAGSVR